MGTKRGPIRSTRRRSVVVAGTGILALISGCVGDFDGEPPNRDPGSRDELSPEEVELTVDLPDDEGGTDVDGLTPAEAVVAYYEAILNGDTARADELVHPDAPLRPIQTQRNQEQLAYIDSLTTARTEREVDAVAAVHVTVDVRGVDSTMAYHLRLARDRWTQWARHPGTEAAIAPVAAILARFREQTVRFEHLTGEPLSVAELSFVGLDREGQDHTFDLTETSETFSWNNDAVGDTFESGGVLAITPTDYEQFMGGEVALVHGLGTDDPVAFPRPFATVPDS